MDIKQRLEARAAQYKAAEVLREHMVGGGSAPSGPQSDAQLFWQQLGHLQRSVTDSLAQAAGVQEDRREEWFRALIRKIREFQENLSTVIDQLAPYEAQKALRLLAESEGKVRGKKQRLVPRKPFRFARARHQQIRRREQKRQQEVSSITSSDDAVREDTIAAFKRKAVNVISGLKGESVTLELSDATLINLVDCTVQRIDPTSGLRCRSLVNCVVEVGPVNGSVIIHQCRGCTFKLKTAQLRVHKSSHCTFLLDVGSDPIIEDSTTLTFAPLANSHNRENKWDRVKDFNALVGSPNFTLSTTTESNSTINTV